MLIPGAGAIAGERMKDLSRRRDRGLAKRAAGIEVALRESTFFAQCSKRELRLVAKLAVVRNAPAGSKLVEEGDDGDIMYVLLSGTAAVHKGGRKIADLGPGAVIGELAILSKAPRNATVTTRDEAEIAMITRRSFNRLLEDAPGFARKILEAMAQRIRELDRRVVG